MKTNATRQLDKLGVAYELREYEVDPNDLSAIKVAGQIGLPASQVFKTLCAKGDDGTIVLAVVPGNGELDLKALARVSGHRRMELAPVAQLQQLTGYIRGGVTALACKKSYPVYLDESALRHPVMAVSAGVRGTQILLAPSDYARAVNAVTGALIRAANPPESPAHLGILSSALSIGLLLAPLTTAMAAVPTNNRLGAHYSGSGGAPAWTEAVRWPRVLDMPTYSKGQRQGCRGRTPGIIRWREHQVRHRAMTAAPCYLFSSLIRMFLYSTHMGGPA